MRHDPYGPCEPMSTPDADTDPRRVIALDEQPNFRDLGGYPTADGRTTRWGMIYRSGELSTLTDADLSRLEDLGIASVIDLRSEREADGRGRDRLPGGADHLHLPIVESDQLLDLITERFEAKDFTDPAPDLLADVNRSLATQRLEIFGRLVQQVARGPRPVVFHCTHGKDRAGFAAALVLHLVGVERETIEADYLLSNECRREMTEAKLADIPAAAAEIAGLPEDSLDLSWMRRLFVVETEFLRAGFAELHARFDSPEDLATKGLGLASDTLATLRDEFTE